MSRLIRHRSVAAVVRPLCVLGGLLFFSGFSALALAQENGCTMRELPASTVAGLDFQDDLDFRELLPAIAQSQQLLQKLPPERQYQLCGRSYSVAWLRDSMREFETVVRHSPTTAVLKKQLAAKFTLCQAGSSERPEKVLLTGYYEPQFAGSLQPDAVYRHPLYRRPADLVEGERDGKKQPGRYQDGQLLPYWSRAEIEEGNLLQGDELVYLSDPLAPFVLQVQGSGRVQLPDGTMRRVQFAGKNGRPYRSIGKLLVEEGVLAKAFVDLPRILRYLKTVPVAERNRILRYNESYVFFRWGNNQDAGPLGCFGVPLTAGRSLAVDQRCVPPGTLGFLRSRKPRVDQQGAIVGWEPFSRFVVNQDSGSAIVGSGRADLFWGSGSYAQTAAGSAKHRAELLFLIKKK